MQSPTTRKNRETGTYIQVGNAEYDGWDSDGGDWYTLCQAHSEIVNHPTLSLARAHAAVPSGWCAGCNHKAHHTDAAEWGCWFCYDEVTK